jgi:hypothetical protein
VTPPNVLCVEAIENRSERIPEAGCWLWIGTILSGNYGQLSVNGHRLLAHRASYLAHHGQIPVGLLVLHQCDVPCCVNPAHLFLGTNKDNTADMMRKGRDRTPRGATNGASKLSEDDVRAIRASPRRNCDLVNEFGVCDSVISEIRSGKSWRHIL